MPTVEDVLAAKRAEPFAKVVRDGLARKRMIQNDLAAAMWGRDLKGRPLGSGKVSQYLSGKATPNIRTLELMGAALDVPVAELQASLGRSPTTPPPPNGGGGVAEPAAPARPRTTGGSMSTDQFCFVIDERGRASIRVNLTDLDVGRALRVMGALTTAGLLPSASPPPEPEREPHEDEQQ